MAAALECWSGRPSTDEDMVEQVLMQNHDRSEAFHRFAAASPACNSSSSLTSSHRNSLAGSTRHKFASPAPAGSNGDHGSASGPSTSSSTTAGLSPTTPLTVSMDEELLRRLPQEAELDGEELVEDEADEDDGVLLLVEDMEVAGEDDFLFMGVTQDTAAASTGTEESDLLHFLATTAGTTSSLPVAM